MEHIEEKNNRPVLLFDGVCNLCNNAVQFILRNEHTGVILFSPLQSTEAKNLLIKYNLETDQLDTLVYIRNNLALTKSDAVIAILGDMGGIWRMGSLFKLLPKAFRDYIYEFIVRKRYGWFGKKDTCMVPNEAISNRFI